MDTLSRQCEAILFTKASPVSLGVLAKATGQSTDVVRDALLVLDGELAGRGVVLAHHDGKYMLRTHPDVDAVVRDMYTGEVASELSPASLETFTIVAYRGPVTKAHVDYVRGVNSQYSLRHLLVRGLIQKKHNPEDRRRPHYTITLDALGFLGVARIEDLPSYDEIRQQLDAMVDTQEDEAN